MLRRVLASVLLVLVLAALPTAAPAATDCVRTVAGLDLQTVTIPQLQEALSSGRLTSSDLVDAYLARIDAYDGRLNAIRVIAAGAREQAARLDAERRAGHVRGPLHGIPVLLKDNYNTTDMPTTAGSIALEGVTPRHDATATAKLRDAGAIILGKTELSEFAGWVDLNMPPGYSSLGGQVVNANDFTYTPSGSSAGSGVAASMALATATLGTETSGSILSPSDANGDVGVKTTLGLASRYDILPLAPDFDVPGPLVRTVTDAAVMLGAIAGPDAHDPATAGAAAHLPPGGDYTAGLRADAVRGHTFTYAQDDRDNLSDEKGALFDAAVARLERMGAKVVPSHSLGSTKYGGLAEIAAVPNEFKASFNQYLADEMPSARVHSLSDVIAYNDQHPDKVKYGQNLLQASDATPGRPELFPPQAEPSRQSARAAIDGALAETGAEAVLTPGNADANIGAAAGYPTVIVPNGYTTQGVRPFGLGFMGQAFTEARLLGYAYAYEQATHARVAPTDLNARLAPASCPARTSASGPALAPPKAAAPARVLRPLRVTSAPRGRRILLTVRPVAGATVRVVVRHGRRAVARRTVHARHGVARLRIGPLKPGRYRVTVLDPGPPPRTAGLRLRQQRPRTVTRRRSRSVTT